MAEKIGIFRKIPNFTIFLNILGPPIFHFCAQIRLKLTKHAYYVILKEFGEVLEKFWIFRFLPIFGHFSTSPHKITPKQGRVTKFQILR